MGKNPAFQFYPADWLSDNVAGCSIGAQGLWLRMMFQMHASERYGYLVTNNKPTPDDVIARHAGVTRDIYVTLLEELEKAGVPRRTKSGILYSKRMVEDETRRKNWRNRQQNHRDKRNPRHAVVTSMSRLSSSSSSSSSLKTLPNPLMTQTPASREGNFQAVIEIQVHGETVLLTKPKGRRIWTEREKNALVGSRAADYVEFFRSKGFTAEIRTSTAPETHANGNSEPDEKRSARARRSEELRAEWQRKRESGELPPGVGVSEYRQAILEQEGLA